MPKINWNNGWIIHNEGIGIVICKLFNLLILSKDGLLSLMISFVLMKNTVIIVSSIDIYPTLMELCGVKMPFETDGKSMVGLMKNPSLPSWSEVTYGYFANGITVRTDRYRLTRYFRSELPNVELYDHKVDPFENRNIANENPGLVEQLMPVWEKGNTGLYSVK